MRLWWTILTVLALALPVEAGDSSDPEVTDPLEDDLVGSGTDASNSMDIEFIFVQEGGTCGTGHLYFEMKLANLLEDDQSSGPEAFKEVTFNLRGEEHVLVGTALTPEFTLDGETVDGGIDNDPLEAYWWCVPADAVGGLTPGDVVDGIWGRAVHGTGEETDRAPDDGTGRAYVIGQDAGIDATADLFLPTNAAVVLENGTGSFSFDVTNNGTGNDTVHIETNGTAGWNVTVDPANQTLAPGENGTFTLQVDGNGTGPIVIGVVSELGFRGSFTVDVMHETSEPGSSGGTGTSGNGTTDSDTGGKESPSPLWLVAVAIGVVAAMRRRW